MVTPAHRGVNSVFLQYVDQQTLCTYVFISCHRQNWKQYGYYIMIQYLNDDILFMSSLCVKWALNYVQMKVLNNIIIGQRHAKRDIGHYK